MSGTLSYAHSVTAQRLLYGVAPNLSNLVWPTCNAAHFQIPPWNLRSRGEMVLLQLRERYHSIILRAMYQQPVLQQENHLVFASDILVGGHFPHIQDAVREMPLLDRVEFIQFLIEYKIQSNNDGKCKKCGCANADSTHEYFCDKCARNWRDRTCALCRDAAFLFAECCLPCAAYRAYF